MSDLSIENSEETINKAGEAEIKKLLKRMRPAMLSAMRKQAELFSVGIRSEITQWFDEKTGKYVVAVIPNKVDVAIYKKGMGV